MSRNSAAYLQSVEAVEDIDPPAIGFTKASNHITSSLQIQASIKQNNTIIELLLGLDRKVSELTQLTKDHLKQKGPESPEVIKSIAELSDKLAGLNITTPGERKPIKVSSGPYYVFKNPKVILEEEKQKK